LKRLFDVVGTELGSHPPDTLVVDDIQGVERGIVPRGEIDSVGCGFGCGLAAVGRKQHSIVNLP
jgi:hypothetical protein